MLISKIETSGATTRPVSDFSDKSTERLFSLNTQTRPQIGIDTHIRLASLLSELQFAAYKDRLLLQPGGRAIQAQLIKTENTPQNKLIRLSIGTQLLDALGAMGQDVLKLLRSFGQQLSKLEADKFHLQKPENFEKTFILGLNNKSGRSFSLSPHVLLTLASIFHNSWRKTVTQPAFSNHTPLTSSQITQDKNEFYDLPLKNPSIINYDSLTVFFLCRRLGNLSERDFNGLLSIAVPGNPHGYNLSYYEGPKDYSPIKDITPSISATARAIKAESLSLPSIERREAISKSIEQGILEFNNQLQDRESQILLPIAFSKIDSGLGREEFYSLCQSLEEIKVLREQFQMGVTLVAEVIFAFHPIEDQELGILSNVKKIANQEVIKLINDLEKAYNLSIDEFLSQQNIKSNISTVSNLEEFLNHSEEIRDIINSVKLKYDDPEFRKRGGILYDYYDASFWQSFFEAGGKLYLYKQDQGIKGFLIGYTAGSIPSTHDFVPAESRFSKDSAYAELVVTTSDRPKGTLRKLMQSMIARLQLTEAKSVDFVVYDFNLHSLAVQKSLGFFARPIKASSINTPDGQSANLVPFRLPLPTNLLKALSPLQQSLDLGI